MFSGPGGDYSGGLRDRYQRVMDMARDQDDGYAVGRPGGGGSIDTSLLEHDARRDAERQQLLMTPGIRRGGSTATRPQSDSPLNVGSSQRFDRFGESYSYDPYAAAEEVGSTEATKQNAADSTRYNALLKMPGFTQAQASRLVYGRGQAFDQEEKQHEMEQALGEYVRHPSPDAAASAIEHGARPEVFNPNFGIGVGAAPSRVVLGSREYRQAQDELMADREARTKREIELRDSLKPDPQTVANDRANAQERECARIDAGQRRGEMQRVLARRPKPSQYVDPMTRTADKPALEEALTNFRADSTETADALQQAQEHLRVLTGDSRTPVSPPPGRRAPALPVRPIVNDAIETDAPAASAAHAGTPLTAKLATWLNSDLRQRAARAQYLAGKGYVVP